MPEFVFQNLGVLEFVALVDTSTQGRSQSKVLRKLSVGILPIVGFFSCHVRPGDIIVDSLTFVLKEAKKTSLRQFSKQWEDKEQGEI